MSIDALCESANKVVLIHEKLSSFLKEGQTLPQIDRFIAKCLSDLKCKSAFLGYQRDRIKFPSYACLSVNDCIVHGTAAYYEKPLVPGDVIKIDIGVIHKGWIGDAAWTYVIKEMSPEIKQLTDCGKEAIKRGISTLKIGNTLEDWAKAITLFVEGECRLFVIDALGGHGYGRELHGKPYISNFLLPEDLWPERKMVINEGMSLAVEPMISLSTRGIRRDNDRWPIFTKDKSIAVHYEHDVFITQTGPEVLTLGLEKLPTIVG